MMVSILVTGIGGGSHGEQILKALKLARKLNIFIIGTDITDLSSGKELVDVFYKLPKVTDPEYLQALDKVITKYDVSFVFHGSESELKFLSENRAFFEDRGIGLPLNSLKVINLCMDKYKTLEKLNTLGVDTGKYKKINKIEDIEDVDFFPVILKPSTGSGGSMHVNICFDKEDLRMFASYQLKYGFDLLVQEYIDSPNEYTVGVTSNDKGIVLGSIAVKRLMGSALTTRFKIGKNGKDYIISSGVSQGQIIKDTQLLSQAENLARQLKSQGPLNIQCRVLNGKMIPFEINPRLSGTTSLRAMAGYNDPEMMIMSKVFNKQIKVAYKEITVLRTLKELVI